ncbi:RmlC-like cupin domain-containing protein [Kalaharituber pfeilii]|nr:RmlC-like cupin domain-containing protein [Kalaharituber pfeilii]
MADPHRFWDPFFQDTFRIELPELYKPAPVGETSPEELPVTGQGTIAVLSPARNLLEIKVKSLEPGVPTLSLRIGQEDCDFYYETINSQGIINSIKLKGPHACDLNSGVRTNYWFSIDRNNGLLRYGKYFTNVSMTLMQATLKVKNKEGVMVWKDPQRFAWIEKVKHVIVIQDRKTKPPPAINIKPLPVVQDLSPFVVSSEKITLQELEWGTYTVPANLPEACQQLYGNVAGVNITLNDPTFPDFSDAIQHSCITPGCWAYEKLRQKTKEFGDLKETYLRITLGFNLGDSPGVPYVLEIWPSGHFSPIHDHGRACAVIKILHGSITASYYDSLRNPQLIGRAKLMQGNITWLGPNNYQIHKLYNHTTTVCCTIQCYRYEDQENVHEDVFHYTDRDGKEKKFIPNSDMAFTEFRMKMMAEWYGVVHGKNGGVIDTSKLD